jgi:CubicO group peptidase (beta-lactamase class C family)
MLFSKSAPHARSSTELGTEQMEPLRTLLLAAIDARIFPAAVAEIGDADGARWREAFGTLAFDDTRRADDATVFDLASLTKPIVTTTVVMDLAAFGRVDLRDPVAAFFPEWRGIDREAATVEDLLEHAAGLPGRLADPPPESRREFEHDICTLPLECPLRSKSIYSDLGFILEPLPDDLRRGRRLVGEVHDNYAARLGEVAGHAGLFGTVGGVGSFARAVLRGARGDDTVPAPLSPPLVARAVQRSAVPGSSRALGWDTMLPSSSCGTKLSPAAFGHVGFTGTSLWIDPIRDRYFVLLTNRVCGGGTEAQIKEVRRAFHDEAADL